MNTQTQEALKMLDAMRLSYSDLIYNEAGFEKAEEFEDSIIAVKEAIATNEESSVVQPAQESKALRDEFAMAALSGTYAAQGGANGWIQHDEKKSLLILAKDFYKMADAMIKARELSDE